MQLYVRPKRARPDQASLVQGPHVVPADEKANECQPLSGGSISHLCNVIGWVSGSLWPGGLCLQVLDCKKIKNSYSPIGYTRTMMVSDGNRTMIAMVISKDPVYRNALGGLYNKLGPDDIIKLKDRRHQVICGYDFLPCLVIRNIDMWSKTSTGIIGNPDLSSWKKASDSWDRFLKERLKEQRVVEKLQFFNLSTGYFRDIFEDNVVFKYDPLLLFSAENIDWEHTRPQNLVLQVLRYVGPVQFRGVDKHLLLVSDGELSMLASTANKAWVSMAKGKDTCNFIIKVGDFELDDMIPVREHMDGRFSYNLKNDVVASFDGVGGSYYRESLPNTARTRQLHRITEKKMARNEATVV